MGLHPLDLAPERLNLAVGLTARFILPGFCGTGHWTVPQKKPLSILLPSANERWSKAQRLPHLTDQGGALVLVIFSFYRIAS